jgi:hypothetical protein
MLKTGPVTRRVHPMIPDPVFLMDALMALQQVPNYLILMRFFIPANAGMTEIRVFRVFATLSYRFTAKKTMSADFGGALRRVLRLPVVIDPGGFGGFFRKRRRFLLCSNIPVANPGVFMVKKTPRT